MLFDSDSKINTIYLIIAKELDIPIRSIDVRVWIINGTMLNTYGMVVVAFSVIDKANQIRFFEKTFLMTNISLKVVFKMLFLIISNANIDFLR